MALDTPLAIEFDYRWQPQSAEDAPPKVGQLAQVPFGRRQVTGLITESGLSPMQTMWMLIGLYLILGMFMESLSMMIATVPIITPVVIAMGFDPVWFGILMMVLLETALITPPVGLNLFIVQGVRPRGQIRDVMIGSLPFVVAMLAMVVVLVLYPDLALWLPRTVGP